MNLLQAFSDGLRKSYPTGVTPYSRGGTSFLLPSTGSDWAAKAGDLHANAVVAICLNWCVTKLTQTSLVLQQETDEEWANLPDPDFLKGLREPNEAHNEHALWASALMSLIVNGNAYWIKRRGNAGQVVGYMPIYHQQIKPDSQDAKRYVTRYLYAPSGSHEREVPMEDVVHFRWPMPDPKNPSLGLSPLSAMVRSIVGYNGASNWENTVIDMAGWAPVFMSPKMPKEGQLVPLNEEGRNKLKQRWQDLTGDRRGEPMIAPVPMDIQGPLFKPNDLALDKLKNLSAVEICAAMQLDALAMRLPSPNNGSYDNNREAREDAIESGLMPKLTMLAGAFQADAVREWSRLPGSVRRQPLLSENQRLAFDLSGFRELQEDEDAKQLRARENFKVGGITLGEYRRSIGMKDGLDDPRTYFDLSAKEQAAETNPDAKQKALSIIRRMNSERNA